MACWYGTCKILIREKRGVARKDNVCMPLEFLSSLDDRRMRRADRYLAYIELN